MKGRTKPQNIPESVVVTGGDFYLAENRYLKEKNSHLAKALADLKIAYSQMVAERDMVQQELFNLHVHHTKLLSYVKDIDMSARASMNTIVSSSNFITNILQLTNSATTKLKHDISQFLVKSPLVGNNMNMPNNKTHAVKPMIDGHVIFNPRINLRRVNETPQRDITGSLTLSNLNTSPSTSSSPRSTDNNSNTPDIANTCRTAQPSAVIEPFAETSDDHEELADEYMDDSMEESEDISAINNGLDTVQEEQEEDLQDTHHGSLMNASSNSLGASGNGSQVPLLSGVFRDVRVYLSPMQNVSQCGSDAHSHINTERGSGKARRTSSLFLSRTSDKLARRSSASLVNIPGENNRRNTNFENDEDHKNTLENSFSSPLQASLLSSARISSPIHTPWVNVMKRRKSFNNTSNNNDDLSNAETNYSSLKDRHSITNKNRFSPLLNNHQQNRLSSTNTDYDPLEGPSTLLDTPSEVSFNKTEKLEILQGIPDTPPSDNFRRTRAKRRLNENQTKSPKATQQKSREKRKPVISSKVAKVILARMSISNSSPGRKKNSLNRSSSSEKSRRKSSESPRVKEERCDSRSMVKNEKQHNSSPRVSTPRTPRTSTPRKMKKESKSFNSPLGNKCIKKSRSKLSEQVIKKRSKLSQNTSRSSSTSQSPESPGKRGQRPRRALQQVSCKEPSLRKKMRRSK